MRKPKIVLSGKTVIINGKKAKRLRTRGGRECFVADGVIVKLNDNLRQSSKELRYWNRLIEPGDRQYFVPPIAGQVRGKGWIAQRLERFRRGRRSRVSKEAILRIAQKYGISDLTDWNENEDIIIPCNWGILNNGKPKIFDWGH